MSNDLSIKVRVKLVEKNLTMTKLAKELGMSTAYLSDIINGKKDGPKAQEHVKRIKKILSI
ncbi:helix-turn-helix domain-containing protein [Carnobacterium sp. TMP28]|uniref:helix-turn-helix domain-containing protein n=1 Tax=Carnobacterium sp. TMP28 TaxID=3397060 RepID=UPI0039E08BF6